METRVGVMPISGLLVKIKRKGVVTPRLRGSAAGPGGLPVPSSRFRGGLSTGEVTLLGALGNDGFQGIGAKLFASGSATEPLRVNRPTSVESRLVGP